MPTGESHRVTLRSVAVPSEHGGWSLTLEPVILALLVAPSAAGWALGAAALMLFVVRTPLKIVLVDGWRGRTLMRTRRAIGVLAVESVVIAGFVAMAIAAASFSFWWPLLAAVPLVGLELWYDMRSRSRHAAPEIAGVVGIGAVGAMIALAGGAGGEMAVGVWLVTAARSVAAVGFVRVALRRAKGQEHNRWFSDLFQAGAVAAGGGGLALGLLPWPAASVIAAAALFAVAMTRWRPVPAHVVGAQQVVVGLTVVLAAGLSMRAW